MNLAKVSTNVQIPVSAIIRRQLNFKEGEKLLFIKQDKEVTIRNAFATAIARAQEAFLGATKDFGFADSADVQGLMNETIYGSGK